MTFPKVAFAITYNDTTPESSEHGDWAETGFLNEEWEPGDFRSLIRHLEGHGYTYWSTTGEKTVYSWLSTSFEVTSYETGTERELSIHPKNARALRYLLKACKHLNIK